MDQNFMARFSGMGVRDCGNAALESSFTDLERVISLLLEDSNPSGIIGESRATLLPQSQNLRSFLIEDKSCYFSKVSTNIMETKKNFLQVYADINAGIDEMIQQIVLRVFARQQRLKDQLQKLKTEKVAKWDRQLGICQEALEQLTKCQLPAVFRKDLFFDELTKELEFVDAGEVKLDLVNYSEILRGLETVGKITAISNQQETIIDGLGCFKSLTPKFMFGDGGDEPGQFCRPWGICADPTGRILVCDRSNHRIQVFNESGEFLLQFGKQGSGPGEFNRPTGLDVNDKCRIIVADKDNHRIQVFSFSGGYLFSFGTQGSEAGQFMYPWDVSTNKNCDIAVSDSKNNRVQLFDERGRFIAIFVAQNMGIRNPRTALRYLDSPRGLAFRPDGSLLVTDFNNHRILLIDKAFNKATPFGSEGLEPGHFFRPQGIACDKTTGKFAVADSKNYRVQVFDSKATFLKSFGSQGNEPGQFDCPQGISFHSNQNILVVDLGNNRVQVF